MIVIPAILVAFAEAAFIGGLAGAVICGMEDRRNLAPDADKSERTAHKCAEEGAIVSGAISLAFPFFGVFDDIARPAAGLGDEALNIVDDVAGIVDDATKPASGGARQVARSLTRHLNAPLKLEENLSRSSFYRSLRVADNANPKAGFVYVIDDVSNPGQYKIGRTLDPARRLREISRTVRNEVNFVCIILTNHMSTLEHALHTAFAAQRLPNTGAGTEWFKLSRIQVAAACSQ